MSKERRVKLAVEGVWLDWTVSARPAGEELLLGLYKKGDGRRDSASCRTGARLHHIAK